MSWGFTCAVTGGGRGLLVRRGAASVAELVFGLPGEPVPGWEPDETEARLTQGDHTTARLRHIADPDGWTTVVSLDNTDAAERALPPLGMVVTVHPGWVGWSWTSDTEGFVVLAPADAAAPVLLVRVRQGFLRAASGARAFTPHDRRGDALGDGVALFHLAHPTGSLRPFARHQTTLEFEEVDELGAARGVLPAWLPDLVIAPGDDLRLETPDLAIVPGHGVQMGADDITSVLVGEPGHREVAVHGVRGVQRLWVTYRPALDRFVADLVAALKSRRPSSVPSATGALVAGALSRRAVLDPEATLDWLEREDWLARGDLFGVAAAGIVATETLDEALLVQACEALTALPPQDGRGIIATRLWLATLRLGVAPLDLTTVLDPGGDGAGVEAGILGGGDEERWTPTLRGHINSLGGGLLPGRPLGLSEADAGHRAALLRLVPEGWALREAASLASERASALLLADHADGLHPAYDGLAWLVLGEIGA
ncbi:MAG: hypothetical protein Q4F65_10115 [Propionibacteriaceae bacterium]|nr:hypothetical protein [Propionibacteriaceae bacterium]